MDDHSLYGQNEVIITGPKKMNRRQQWEWMRDNPQAISYNPNSPTYGKPFPRVEARYRISRHPQDPRLLAMHPDGSIFYEYVEGSKRELP